MNRMLICAVLLASISAHVAPKSAAAGEAPKLVVVVVVDQTRRSEIDRLEPHFTGGFRRLFNEGARLDGHYGQQNTYTGPGHALILSGSYGYLNGIFQNAWFNRATGRSESMLFDETVQVINQGTVNPGEDSSPRNFYGATVGDELRMSNGGKSRVVALAIKERGALLLGGRTGTAYFFNDLNGEWTTSTYYMNALPDWLVAFNAKRLPDQWFGKEWTRCLPEAVYGPEPDDAPWEADQLGLGRTFPHKITGGEQKPTGKYWQAFTNSPFAIDHTFEFACAAVEGEGLGQDEITDVLAISVSPTDFLGHAYGTYSHEVRDSFLRTDRALGEFFTYLDKRLGQRGWIALVTADHGSAQPPERARRSACPPSASGRPRSRPRSMRHSARASARATGSWRSRTQASTSTASSSRSATRGRGGRGRCRRGGDDAIGVPGLCDAHPDLARQPAAGRRLSGHCAQLFCTAGRGRRAGASTFFVLGQVRRMGFRLGARQLLSL